MSTYTIDNTRPTNKQDEVVSATYGNYSPVNIDYWNQLQRNRSWMPNSYLAGTIIFNSEHMTKTVRNPMISTAIREGRFDLRTGKFQTGYPHDSVYTVCPTPYGMTFNATERNQSPYNHTSCSQGALSHFPKP